MDFQKIVDGIDAMACIMSIEKLEGGRYGKLRIVTGNKAYMNSVERPEMKSMKLLKPKFVPGSEYTDYLTRDLNFEAFCYGAAVEKKCLHSYAYPESLQAWFNMTFLPVAYEEGNLCYCIYVMEVNLQANAKHLSSLGGEISSSVLQTCIKLKGSNDFYEAMNDIIKDIGELCEAEDCCILHLDYYERKCSVICEYIEEGSNLSPMETYLDKHFFDIANSWEDTIAGSNCIIVRNEQEMEVLKERNPVWHASLVHAKVHNIALFPLKAQKEVLGYIWAINFNTKDSFKIKEILEITTFILGAELRNQLLMNRLKVLSSKDMLTGVMNRNEMNNFVESISKGKCAGKSVGVIFADLNGLKTVNDKKGHVEGDNLLKTASSALLEVFAASEIYRAGGDEFTIITTDITDDELKEKIAEIRRVCEKKGVSFAIGGCTEKDSRDVRCALRRADELMYEDKERYYEAHKELKRRDTSC